MLVALGPPFELLHAIITTFIVRTRGSLVSEDLSKRVRVDINQEL
jgi:hypothetical protein